MIAKFVVAQCTRLREILHCLIVVVRLINEPGILFSHK